MKIVVRIVQLLFAILFIFSGLAKCVDPIGTSIKVTEYLQYFGFDMLTDLSMGMAWMLCIVEFLCGVNMLLGHVQRLTLVVSSLLLLVFTPLTLWLAVTNAISECGCFGDAVHLTNWQTFSKNLLLDAMLILLWVKRELMYKLMGRTFYVFYIYWAFGCAVWLCWLGTWREPFIDFRPYNHGTNLKEAVMGEEHVQSSEAGTEYICIYQRNGVSKEFPLDNLPDESEGWEFVETVERNGNGKEADKANWNVASHIDFYVKSADGEIITDELLSRPGYTLLLLSHSLDKASQHDIDRIELLSEYAEDNNYAFLCLTARDEKQLERWIFNTGAEYRFVFTDASIIETMCRSNPAVMLLRDGIICWKQPLSILDAQELTSGKLDEQTSGDIEEINGQNRILFVLFLLFAPFFLYLLVEILQKIHNQSLKKYSKNA
ncbi:MAG: DoxX family membrane protein [Bacteroidales bacterium]|nr:DoxX family membrane protein [Bacteroidales bacterium]